MSLWRSGLFRRIYFTFVVTVIAATFVGVLGATWTAQTQSRDWIGATVEVLSDQNEAIVSLLDDDGALGAKVDTLQQQLHARVGIYDIDGFKLAGAGPNRTKRPQRRYARRLRQGLPVIRERKGPRQAPVVIFPLTDRIYGETIAIARVDPGPRGPRVPLLVSTLVVVMLLGVGAWALSRSLIVRLARLERSAERIASGELEHRVELDQKEARDELDELGLTFNDMADRVQRLMRGQQTLLANVSHELRTPIARIKVLLELLQDRLELMGPHVPADAEKHLSRLRSGLAEMDTDTMEIEKLISDLLTSGRLELKAGDTAGLEITPVDLGALAKRMASRADATVDAPEALVVQADEMLVERLLSNLLANARRACPDGVLTVTVAHQAGAEHGRNMAVILVEDQGPGIAPDDREQVFEPFRRLDGARSRDEGGVGLGLYLCRQIARAHGGDVVASGRADGASGASMVVTLPAE